MTGPNLPQDSTELRRINWTACFPFTNLFRTFRIAVQPGKLGLALAAVLLTAIWGWLLDGLWSTKCQPPAGEVNVFWQQGDVAAWRQNAKARWSPVIREAYRRIGEKTPEKLDDRLANDPDEAFDMAIAKIRSVHQARVEAAREQTRNESDEKANAEIARRVADCIGAYGKVESIRPRGVYASFMEFERRVGRQMVNAATHLNFADGLAHAFTARSAGVMSVGSGLEGQEEAYEAVSLMGVLPCAVLALRGLQWMVTEHFWFAVLFWVPALVIWGLAGGAICRMAALNIARDEHLSPAAALRFAQRKLLSLATAPLFPVGFVLGIGVLLLLGGVVTAIPAVGGIVGGLGMGLALAAGLLMAATVIGGVAGWPLMWPTIAVEGSDAFDAFSRGYSYVFSRPWRAAFYAAVLSVYGAICYLFVRLFVLVGLKGTRFFVGAGLAGTDRPGTGHANATKIDTLWPAPTWDQLLPDRLPLGAQIGDTVGAFLVGLWLAVVVGLLCAFAASYFLSGSTIAYGLLRREVDATDFEEVYLDPQEQEEEEETAEFPVASGQPGAVGAPPAGGGAATSEPGPVTPESPGSGDRDIDAE